MTIKKRPKKDRPGEFTYRIRVYAGKDADGKNIIESTTYSPDWTTKTGKLRSQKAVDKEAEDFARQFEKDVLEGKYSSKGRILFRDFVNRWYDEKGAKTVSENTRAGYMHVLQSDGVMSVFGNKEMQLIRISDINAYIRSQEEKISPKTIKRHLCAVSSVFEYAIEEGIITDNPVLKAKVRNTAGQTEDKLHFFTVPQAKAFLNFIGEPWESGYAGSDRTTQNGTPYHVNAYSAVHYTPIQYQSYFMLAIYGGFRRGEIVALTWNDIDFEKCTVSITKAAARETGKGCIIKGPKSRSGIRTLTLPKECFDTLREWKRAQKELCLKLGSVWEGKTGREFDDNFIFIQLDNGRMMDVSTPTAVFRKLLKRYNETHEDQLPQIRLHDLRHTSATLMLPAGVDIAEISRRLGHSGISVTLDVYSHAMPQSDQQASDIISLIFGEKSPVAVCK